MSLHQIVTVRDYFSSSPIIFGLKKFDQLSGGSAGRGEITSFDFPELSSPVKMKGAVTEAEFDRLAKLEEELRSQLGYFSAADAMTREELYDRDL